MTLRDFKTSWKTSLSGGVLAVSLFVNGSGIELPKRARQVLLGLMAVSAGTLGGSAKDADKSGDPPKEMKN